MGNIGSTYNGLSGLSRENFVNGSSKYITYKSIFDNNVLKNDLTEPVKLNDKKQNLVKNGDLFFTGSSETPEEVGMVSVLNCNIENCYLNSFCFGFRLYDNNINPIFLAYYLRSPVMRNKIQILSQGSTRFNLSKKEVLKLKCHIPCIDEQNKISKFLLNIDKKIELLTKMHNYYLNFKKYLMQQIFTQKLRFDFNIIKLNDICDINKGKQLNKENMVNFGEYYVLNGGKEPSGYTNSWNTPANTITISEGGNSCGYVNFNEEKFWSGGHCYFLSNLSSKIDLYYLFSYLKFIEPSIMRLRVGSGLPNIQKGDIENIKVKTVPINEQIKIRKVLRIIDKKISTLKVQKEHFEVFKKGLLQQMFV